MVSFFDETSIFFENRAIRFQSDLPTHFEWAWGLLSC